VQFGTVISGFNVRLGFSALASQPHTVRLHGELRANAWYATFTIDGPSAFARPVLEQAAQGFASAIVRGTNGGFGLVPTCPATTVRVEVASNLTSTVSFCVVEILR
jgi:hypothetical protein